MRANKALEEELAAMGHGDPWNDDGMSKLSAQGWNREEIMAKKKEFEAEFKANHVCHEDCGCEVGETYTWDGVK